MTERRRFRIRACPVCGEVQMPHYRDDRLWCRNSGVREEPPYNGHRATVRLAWFEVTEDDSPVNRANEQARQERDERGGFEEFGAPYEGVVTARNWATGDFRLVPLADLASSGGKGDG